MQRRRPSPRAPVPAAPGAALLLFLLLASCAGGGGALRHDGANRRIDAFGLALGAKAEPRVIAGVEPREEPCLRGIERVYEPLDLSVGVDDAGRVRRIATRNRATAILGVTPGDPFPAAREALLRGGFREGDGAHRFRDDGLAVTLLVDGAGTVFGVSVETAE